MAKVTQRQQKRQSATRQYGGRVLDFRGAPLQRGHGLGSLHIRKIYVTDNVKKTWVGQRIVLLIDRVIQKEFSVPQGGSKFI